MFQMSVHECASSLRFLFLLYTCFVTHAGAQGALRLVGGSSELANGVGIAQELHQGPALHPHL